MRTYAYTLMGAFVLGGLVIGGNIPSFAADTGGSSGTATPGGGVTDKGTIQGEVKKVEPHVVIIEKETAGKDDGKEVRLPLHESTHKGAIKEGDKVEAFVTPGGTTTSVQPKKEGLNR